MMAYLAEFFREGGFFMFVNLFILTVSIAMIIERTIAVGFRLNLNASAFMAQIQKLILSNNVDRAIKMCNAAPNAALARVIRSGLTRSNRGPREVGRALEETVLEVQGQIGKRIPALWSLANVATLIGLTGTITGLIRTFRSLGAASPEMKQLMLSKGIAEAMNNTAFALMIAVTCIIAHMILHNKAKGMIEEVEYHALRLENMLFERAIGETNPLSRG